MNQRLLQILVFTSGACIMGVEMTGLRLLAPYFGTSLLVTTILIGSLMGFMSVGYGLGGRWGDKHPQLSSLGKVTGTAALLVILIPFMGQPVLRGASAALRPLVQGAALDEPTVAVLSIVGGLICVLILFAGPITLMATTSPWAVRLAVDDVESSGKAAGRLYALSTVGSIIGSFLPALALVPLLGVRNTFLTFAVVLLAVSGLAIFAGDRGRSTTVKKVAPPAAVGALMLIPSGTVRPMDGLLYEGESLYHFIQVVQEPYGKCEDAYHLYLNEGVGVHSVRCPDPDYETRGVWTYMASSPLWLDDPTQVSDVLIVGLAGGTIARQMLESFPGAKVDGVEIDGEVVRVGEKWFDNADERINPIVMDGRMYLAYTDKKYDVVMMDAYRQPYIPFHLVTVEFFEEVKAHMKEDAVLVVNVASVRGVSRSLAQMIYKTLREVFPTVVLVDATQSNDIIVASHKEKSVDTAVRNLARIPGDALALGSVRRRLGKKIVGEVEGWQDARILTDDHAPVELAWDLQALEYAK